MGYLLVKALHIALMLFWVAGMVVQGFVLAVAAKLPGPALPQELTRLRLLRKWERDPPRIDVVPRRFDHPRQKFFRATVQVRRR